VRRALRVGLTLLAALVLSLAVARPAFADEPTGECITGGACTHQCSLFCLLEDTEPAPDGDES
jgi:hypothetical protein